MAASALKSFGQNVKNYLNSNLKLSSLFLMEIFIFITYFIELNNHLNTYNDSFHWKLITEYRFNFRLFSKETIEMYIKKMSV